MTESEFLALAEAVLTQVEAAVEDGDVDIDCERSGNVLTLEFQDRSKIIVNLQTPMSEIWVAARAGGFHFRAEAGRWLNTRDGAELYAMLSALMSAQAGEPVRVRPQA